MTITQWLTGANGLLFSSSSAIIILILMLFMSVKLYVSYRNKHIYQLLIAAIMLFLVTHCVLIALAYPGWTLSPWIHMTATILRMVSFIIINFVFMKLYTFRSARIKIIPFIIMIALAFVIAGVQFSIDTPEMRPPTSSGMAAFPLLDFYSIVVALTILLATRNADMNTKYYASLIVFFAYEMARIAAIYAFQDYPLWLALLHLLLPVVYFFLLFTLLFEWVIERLLSTYQSSIIDGLTGLYNRKYFYSKADELVRKSKHTAIIFCDIDNFKALNDTYGHHYADDVLKLTAEIIREEVSGIGTAGRYGGEELLACISGDRLKPGAVAESIRRRVEQETRVTISVGYSVYKEGCTLQDIIRQADAAMYHSKTTGKNKVTAFKSLPAAAKKVY